MNKINFYVLKQTVGGRFVIINVNNLHMFYIQKYIQFILYKIMYKFNKM